jgi:hypothetical protein
MTRIDKVLFVAETGTILLWFVYFWHAMRILGRLNTVLPPGRKVPYRRLFFPLSSSQELTEAFTQLFPHDSALRIADRLFRFAALGMIIILCLTFLAWILD